MRFKILWNVMSSIERLFDSFRDRIPELSKHKLDPDATPHFRTADPWLLASLLQKTIRRGDLQLARRAGHQLLNVDPSRLWRRVMVVGLEDIGLGDPKCAVAVMALATLPQARRLLGGNALARYTCGATNRERVQRQSG